MNAVLEAALIGKLFVALLPVSLFLASLIYLDSYKLVRLRTLMQLMAWGCLAGVLSYYLMKSARGDGSALMGVFGPLVEEVLKGLPILFLLRERRIGFLVDAAIFGFAIGTGFALVENLYYLSALPDAPMALWVVRGFGTAVMHAGTTAILAMSTKVLSDRRESTTAWLAVPGLVAAFAIHYLFNQFLLSPLVSSIVVMVLLPPLLVLVFAQSERVLQQWLGSGFDLDVELIRAINSGQFADSRPGRYLLSLRKHFDGAVVADMLCYIRLKAELSLQAKGLLMMRESGFEVSRDAAIESKFAELQFLRGSIGKTGELALAPIVHRSAHEQWQMHLLEGSE